MNRNHESEELLLEALTRRAEEIFNRYNSKLKPHERPLTEEEFVEIINLDPTHEKMANIEVILQLIKDGVFHNPKKDIKKIIDETTFIPKKKNKVRDKNAHGHDAYIVRYDEYPKNVQEEWKKKNTNLTFSWVLKLLKEKQFIYPEDLPAIQGHIDFFFTYRDRDVWPAEVSKDITSYTSLHDLAGKIIKLRIKLKGEGGEKRVTDILPDVEFIAGEVHTAERDVKGWVGKIGEKTTDIDRGDPLLYEMFRIYPTNMGRLSMINYQNKIYPQFTNWCIAWSKNDRFAHYIGAGSAENLPESKNAALAVGDKSVLDPLKSYYMIAINGTPKYAFDFVSNLFFDERDLEARQSDDYKNIIFNMIKKYIPGSGIITNPYIDELINVDKVYTLPSLIVKTFLLESDDNIKKIINYATKKLVPAIRKDFGNRPLTDEEADSQAKKRTRDLTDTIISNLEKELDSKFIRERFSDNKWVVDKQKRNTEEITRKLDDISFKTNQKIKKILTEEKKDVIEAQFKYYLSNIHRMKEESMPKFVDRLYDLIYTRVNNINNTVEERFVESTEPAIIVLNNSISDATEVINESMKQRNHKKI